MSYRSFSLIPNFSNELISDRFDQMEKLLSRLAGEKTSHGITNYNLVKTDKKQYEMTINVTGYKREELSISVLNNQLVISGKPKEDNEVKKGKVIHQGIFKKSFSLSFNLEHKISIKEAKMENGLLVLRFTYDIPEQEKPKSIEIK